MSHDKHSIQIYFSFKLEILHSKAILVLAKFSISLLSPFMVINKYLKSDVETEEKCTLEQQLV